MLVPAAAKREMYLDVTSKKGGNVTENIFFSFKLNIDILCIYVCGILVEQHMAGKTSEPNRFEAQK